MGIEEDEHHTYKDGALGPTDEAWENGGTHTGAWKGVTHDVERKKQEHVVPRSLVRRVLPGGERAQPC